MTDSQSECQHLKVMPTFDEGAARGLSASEVRRRWPRFEGVCPDCGQRGVIYASYMHYLAGDY